MRYCFILFLDHSFEKVSFSQWPLDKVPTACEVPNERIRSLRLLRL